MQHWKQTASILSVGAFLACGQAKTPAPKKDTPKVLPKAVITAPPSNPAPTIEPKPASAPQSAPAMPIALTAPAGYPVYPYEGLPGWMALASVEKFDGAASYWSPVSTT